MNVHGVVNTGHSLQARNASTTSSYFAAPPEDHIAELGITLARLAAKMARGRAEVIPNTGHLVFLEAPAKYDELVLGFLAAPNE